MVRKAEGGEVVVDAFDLFFGLAHFVIGGDGVVVVIVIVNGGGSGGGDADTKGPLL